ncbi:MAG: PolC-type DNA polymerase III [Clostridia bacterium]|nr:PolC-type DNA polymerase III [Clostridia bacterium]
MHLQELVRSLSDSYEVMSVALLKRARTLSVTIMSRRILPASEIERARETIVRSVLSVSPRGMKCTVVFKYEDAAGQLKADERAAGIVLADLSASIPTIAHVLKYSRVEVEGGRLVIYYPMEAMELMSMVNAERRINAELLRKYGILDGVVTYPSAELQLPAPKYDTGDGYVPGVSKGQPTERQVFGRPIKGRPIKLRELSDASERVTVSGRIIDYTTRPLNKGRSLLQFILSDGSFATCCKLFLSDDKKGNDVLKRLPKLKEKGDRLLIRGRYMYDAFLGEMSLQVADIETADEEYRMDSAPQKRVELHLHTKFSSMDALLEASDKANDAVATAARWGHKAVAITDHGVAHGFPSAYAAAQKAGVKAILGVEGYLIEDGWGVSACGTLALIDVFMQRGERAELVIASARVRNGELACEPFIWRIPAVGVSMREEDYYPVVRHLMDFSPDKRNAAQHIAEIVRGVDAVATFDRKALEALHEACSIPQLSKFVNLEAMLRYEHTEILEFSLGNLAAAFGRAVPVSAAERLEFLASMLWDMTERLAARGAAELPMNIGFTAGHEKGRGYNARHIIILARNRAGLKNLYKLLSFSHMEHFKGVPRIPRTMLMTLRYGLIVGSACEAGELFRAVLDGASDADLERIAGFYDYLEIQPVGNNDFLRREGRVSDIDGLRRLNERIVELGDRLGKPVVATGDVHFLEPEDSVFRTILMHAKGYSDADIQPPLYFRTTDDMLNEFAYLGKEKAYEVVVANTNAIADMCESLSPYLNERRTYVPVIDGADEELRESAYSASRALYGDELPDIVSKRLEKELNSIINNGYASLYIMAQRLTGKSLSEGYLVGSRGSVGSSFVATMVGITEVNPLPPHYVCASCKYSDFDFADRLSRCGIDLEVRNCPVCGAELKRLGYDIPFEVFLGFKGDKTPDIDLNFSGDYQAVAHGFAEEMAGKGHAYKAGTISTVQDKTALEFVRHYCEDKGIKLPTAEMTRLAMGCTGVKRTTGQHPGGIVIVPEGYEIYDFTPVNYPADKQGVDVVTTHFDFHAMDDKLVKLDILGHDDPTALRMLHDLTGVDPKTVPLDDKRTMSLFSTCDEMGISLREIGCEVGSLALPEFGTVFVRGILEDTRPTTMEELVRISGLSHGENLWRGNARDLILDGTATLSEVICLRDDIMNYLISLGGDASMAFSTMEAIRKGKHVSAEMREFMESLGVPEWYINSADKINYLFPRAHAAAYVMMTYRVAYYKLYYPLEFYAMYLSVRATALDISDIEAPADALATRIRLLKQPRSREAAGGAKDEEKLTLLEAVYEMMQRGIKVLPIDIYKSDALRFTIEDGALRPPFVSVSGVGESAALDLARGAQGGEYRSREDFVQRTKANSAVVDKLDALGALSALRASNQVSLFEDGLL